MHADEALLMTISAAGIWFLARKHQAGMIEDGKCHLCGNPSQTDFHMIWECPHVLRSTNPHIIKTNFMKGEAYIWQSRDQAMLLAQGHNPQKMDIP